MSPPTAPHPKPSRDTRIPLRPKSRISIVVLLDQHPRNVQYQFRNIRGDRAGEGERFHAAARCGRRGAGARARRRPHRVHALGQPHHADLRCGSRDRPQARALPPRSRRRAYGRCLGACDGRVRRCSRHRRTRARERRAGPLYGARGGVRPSSSCPGTQVSARSGAAASRRCAKPSSRSLSRRPPGRCVPRQSSRATWKGRFGSRCPAAPVRFTSASPSTSWKRRTPSRPGRQGSRRPIRRGERSASLKSAASWLLSRAPSGL